MIKKWEGIHLSSFMLLSGIDGLLDYQMGESVDVEDWLTQERKAILIIFTACHLGKLKLAFVLAQTTFQLASKTFWLAELISQFFCY